MSTLPTEHGKEHDAPAFVEWAHRLDMDAEPTPDEYLRAIVQTNERPTPRAAVLALIRRSGFVLGAEPPRPGA